jgi:hypothetical protein
MPYLLTIRPALNRRLVILAERVAGCCAVIEEEQCDLTGINYTLQEMVM